MLWICHSPDGVAENCLPRLPTQQYWRIWMECVEHKESAFPQLLYYSQNYDDDDISRSGSIGASNGNKHI
jgi:hypothetical protein